MCRYIADGRSYQKCGHFVRLHVVAMLDCGSRACERSIQHPSTCKSTNCTSNLGPEIQRPVVTYDEYCWHCQSTAYPFLERSQRFSFSNILFLIASFG
ncbi:hypothetical protein PNOK_0842300 [Pyrrhoderma noxium]|uniref:Uncharacterized protein n=1 Tax=Pyrrhoderma noxium TaxID=2282107 RepID=A0A286U7M8_9AGAM|nr:hypothetical protein PNOK_0842300 [Pyrrhoderma noxium]